MNSLQVAVDFIEGKISVDEFMKQVEDSNVLDSLQDLIPKDATRCRQKIIDGQIIIEVVPYNVKEILLEFYALGTLDAKINIFAEVRDVLLSAGIRININDALIEKFRFILVNTPSYIGGAEAEMVLEKIYDQMGIKKIKDFKESVRQKFTMQCKPPKWIQEPDWPVDEEGNPMQFISEKWMSKEEKEYYFKRLNAEQMITIKQSF